MPEKKKARLRYDNIFKTAWTDEFHFIKHSQNAAECTILRPSEKKILGGERQPTAFSLSRVGMYANILSGLFIKRKCFQK